MNYPHMLGVPSPSGHFAQRVWTTLGELGQTSPLTVALAVGGLALLFLGDARRPTIPGAAAHGHRCGPQGRGIPPTMASR